MLLFCKQNQISDSIIYFEDLKRQFSKIQTDIGLKPSKTVFDHGNRRIVLTTVVFVIITHRFWVDRSSKTTIPILIEAVAIHSYTTLSAYQTA